MTGQGAPDRVARVDTEAIRANTRRLKAVAGTPDLIAVVKADGYGHGMVTTARAALDGGATWIGVADPAEALALRAAGVTAPVLAWLLDVAADFGPAVAAGVDLGVSTVDQLTRIAATGPGAAVQLKVETGLSRNGLAPEDWDRAFRLAARLEGEGRIRVRGVFSHLANTSAAEDAAAESRFAEALHRAHDAGLHPELRHLASTAAALRRDQSAYTAVRTGIGLYGVSPYDDGDAARLGLRPAMTLESRIAAVRRIPAGAGVSYDSTWRAERPASLALVPLGYADGVPRAASNRAEVLVGGRRRPIRGRIAMDQFVIETDGDVAVGDPVVVFGDPATGAPSAADWARWADTIGYEIVTRIGPRVQRRPE
ncbi:MAG TPA: alanine racemase [Amnibacterium sp.]